MIRRTRRGADPGSRAAPETDPTLWQALRTSLVALTDDFGRFLGANAIWLLAGVAALGLGRVAVVANALVIVMIPATAGLGRMAAFTGRGHSATLAHLRAGLGLRWPWAVLVGSAQGFIGVFAWVNLLISVEAAVTFVLAVSAAVSAWVLFLVGASAVTLWPLLLDPERDHLSVRSLVRLGIAVVLARPGRVALLVVLQALLVAVALQTMVGAILLPSLGVLVATHAILPIADRLEGRVADLSHDDL